MSARDANTLNRQAWEQTEFPILCETCLGPNPYVRMMKHHLGNECHVCQRPYTVFRWHTGKGGRYKKTVICQTCSKLKNVCQSCILDLEYGVPVEVRDRLLNQEVAMPTSDVNREYFIQNQERAIANAEANGEFGQAVLTNSASSGALMPSGAAGGAGGPGGKASSGRAILEKLRARKPYYERNRARVCTFWAKGKCTRGERCPYRHEMPKDPDTPLAKQTMRDRYYGSNDPVAEKMLNTVAAPKELQAPSDETIKTLVLHGIPRGISDADIKNVFYQYGEIRRVTLVAAQGMAYVDFTSREAAQRAMDGTGGSTSLKGQSIRVQWGRSKALEAPAASSGARVPALPGMPGLVPLPADASATQLAAAATASAPPLPGFGLPPGVAVPAAARAAYPSMDPSLFGSRGAGPSGSARKAFGHK